MVFKIYQVSKQYDDNEGYIGRTYLEELKDLQEISERYGNHKLVIDFKKSIIEVYDGWRE